MTDRELARLRARMDRIDRRLRTLLLQRFRLSNQIIRRKTAVGAPVRDRVREADIVRRLTARLPSDEKSMLKSVYHALFSRKEK